MLMERVFLVDTPRAVISDLKVNIKSGEVVEVKGSGSKDREEWMKVLYKDQEVWIPKSFLLPTSEEVALVVRRYSTHELHLTKGDVVHVLQVIGKWCLARSETTLEEGWIPIENLQL